MHSTLPKKKGYQKHVITLDRGSMFLEVQSFIDGKKINNQFMVHSGYGGTFLFDDEFVNLHHIGDKLKTISESELRDSYGNVLKTKKAILPKLKVGSVRFKDLPIGFFEGAIGRQKMSVMGGNMLKRFNMMIDIKQKQLYLKPNSLMKLPFSTS